MFLSRLCVDFWNRLLCRMVLAPRDSQEERVRNTEVVREREREREREKEIDVEESHAHARYKHRHSAQLVEEFN